MGSSELRVGAFESSPHGIIKWMTLRHLYIVPRLPLRSRLVIDGKSPGEVVFGDRMVQTAYKFE